MSLTFDLAMWDSIDFGEDIFQIKADGVYLFNGNFGNYGTTSGQCEGPGTVLTPSFLDFNNPDYGYGANHDCARHVTFSFAHTSSSAVFSWQYPNSQTAPDESFGIDKHFGADECAAACNHDTGTEHLPAGCSRTRSNVYSAPKNCTLTAVRCHAACEAPMNGRHG